MKTKIYYAGKPCIQAVATAIGQAVGQTIDPLPPSYMPEGLAIAFLGSSDKGGKPVKEALDFIQILDPKRTARVCLFATSPSGDGSKVIDAMRALLVSKGIKVLDETYSCRGKSTFGGKMPDQMELKKAGEFAAKIIKGLSE